MEGKETREIINNKKEREKKRGEERERKERSAEDGACQRNTPHSHRNGVAAVHARARRWDAAWQSIAQHTLRVATDLRSDKAKPLRRPLRNGAFLSSAFNASSYNNAHVSVTAGSSWNANQFPTRKESNATGAQEGGAQ